MKTTFDISNHIMIKSKSLAQKEHVPLKELVEEGLLLVIERHTATPRKKVKPVTFKGYFDLLKETSIKGKIKGPVVHDART